jgi:predicted DNA-binding transcriptional regulator AlpA
MEALLTPIELANILGLSVQTIYNRHSIGGDLPPVTMLGRLLRFQPSKVESWLAKKEVPTKASQDLPRRQGRPTKAEQVHRRTAS